MLTDPIADMLTRIRNAIRVERPTVDMPTSKVKRGVAEMNRAIAVNSLRPVIAKVFSFDSAPAAYQHQASRAFVGKIVIAV